jgi:excisionase family DNA binding protein
VTELLVSTARRALFTVATLAEYLQVSDRTVEKLLVAGEIASFTIGRSRRIDPADVDAYLERQKRSAA